MTERDDEKAARRNTIVVITLLIALAIALAVLGTARVIHALSSEQHSVSTSRGLPTAPADVR